MTSAEPSTEQRLARAVHEPMDPGASSSAGSTLRLYLRQHRRSFAAGAVLTIVGAFVATLPPVLIGQIIDHLGAQADFYLIVLLGLLTVAITAVQALFQATGRYRTAVTARDIEFEMRDDLFHHLQRQDLAYFQHQRIGDLMARMTNDLNAVRMMLAMGIFNLTQTVAVVAFVLVAMLGLSVQLTVISLIILPFVSLTLAVVGRVVHSRFERLQAQFSDISTAAQENLSGVRVVKAFAQETAEIKTFRALCDQYLSRAIHLARADEFIWPAMEGILGLATLLVLVVGSQQAINGQLSLGQLVQFVAYLRLLAWPLVGLGWVSNLFQSGWASLKRLQDLWVARPTIHDEPDATPDPIRGDIEFRNVSFGYGDTPRVAQRELHRAVRNVACHRRLNRLGKVQPREPHSAPLRRHGWPGAGRRHRRPPALTVCPAPRNWLRAAGDVPVLRSTAHERGLRTQPRAVGARAGSRG